MPAGLLQDAVASERQVEYRIVQHKLRLESLLSKAMQPGMCVAAERRTLDTPAVAGEPVGVQQRPCERRGEVRARERRARRLVEGRLAPEDLAGTHETLAGDKITVKGSGEDFTVGKASVICGNVQTANATVYIVDSVLMPTAKK